MEGKQRGETQLLSEVTNILRGHCTLRFRCESKSGVLHMGVWGRETSRQRQTGRDQIKTVADSSVTTRDFKVDA